jgi:signal transduction histidine kinase
MAISDKIILIHGCVSGFAIILISLFIFVNASIYFRGVSRRELETVAESVQSHIESGGEISPDILNDIKQSRYIEIRAINLSNFFRSQTSPALDHFPIPPQSEQNGVYMATPSANISIRIGGFKDSYDSRFMGLTRFAEYNGERFVIQVFRRDTPERDIMRLFGLLFISANAVGLIGIFATDKYISKRILKPITQLSLTAERISVEDLSMRIDATGPDDEIKQLAVTFNDMIARLEDAFNKQKQFIYDASHELRTPISVIQGYANLLRRWGKSDDAVLEESIESINSETKRMATLIKKLLFLAGAESAAFDMTEVSLSDAAKEVQKEAAVTLKGANVTVDAPNPCFVTADYGAVKQLIWILLENAVKYGKTGVVITVGETADTCFFSVRNNGAGIAPEDLPYIFDRFYRADKSRSNEIPGTGLGLAIAKRITDAHDAKISVESAPNEGALFTVKFPKKCETEDSYEKNN